MSSVLTPGCWLWSRQVDELELELIEGQGFGSRSEKIGLPWGGGAATSCEGGIGVNGELNGNMLAF